MSHHKHIYRIYADNELEHTNEAWVKASDWIIGIKHSGDLNEAIALARKAAISCNFPFVVMEISCGGRRDALADVWVVTKKGVMK